MRLQNIVGVMTVVRIGSLFFTNRMRLNQFSIIINMYECGSESNFDFLADIFNGNGVLTRSKLDHGFSADDTANIVTTVFSQQFKIECL